MNAENLLWKNKTYDLTVIRFGGLLGDNRIPGKYFSGKENVPGHPPVNYIHRKDAVNAVLWIIEKNLWNETYNIVCPKHPEKRPFRKKCYRHWLCPTCQLRKTEKARMEGNCS